VVRTALQLSLFEQWNDVHASSTVKCLYPLRQNFKTCAEMGRMHQVIWGTWWQMMILRWNKWPTLVVVMTSHWFSGTKKPYLLQIPCRFQKHLTAVIQILSTHKKQSKTPIFEVQILLCNRMFIYQWMNWSSSSLTHHPQSFQLVSLCRWEILDNFIKRYKYSFTFQVYRNRVIKWVSKRFWLESSFDTPSYNIYSVS